MIKLPDFLHALQAVAPGLSPREILEQSDCFIFQDGQVTTFNDEVCCRAPSGLPPKLAGAVRADRMLTILGKRTDDEVEVSNGDGRLVFAKGSRKSGFDIEAEVKLPVETIETPKRWHKLDPSFADALKTVSRCAGRDESRFSLTCVNVTADWVEACDGFQLARWKLQTPITKPTLIRGKAAKAVADLGMTGVAETANWLHFKNGDLTLSCRRYLEDFPDLTSMLKVSGGKKVAFPKGLADVIDIAKDATSENPDADQVLIDLRPGKVKVTGMGLTCFHTETKKVEWTGGKLAFLVDPDLLTDLVRRAEDCLVAPERIKVDGGAYVWVACLQTPEQAEEQLESAAEEGRERERTRRTRERDEQEGAQ